MSNRSGNPKKKRHILSVNERCNIVQRLKAGESAQSLAVEYNVCKSTISMIKKKGNDIIETIKALNNCNGNIDKKRYRKQEENILDQKLMAWYCQQTSMGRPVSGRMLQKQALLYNQRLNGKENFTASNGWLEKFRKRYGLKNKNIHGEKLSADLEGSEDFKEQFNNFRTITGICLDCIYNCDETRLYWKMMPNRTLVERQERKTEGFENPKDPVTVMTCTNASGSHKIPLLIIGKSAQPHLLRGVNNIPVHYRHQENAWMTCELMKTWYTEIFLPEIKKKHELDKNPETKIVLIMDNAPCHPPAEELNKLCESCTVMFLPPSAMSSIQQLNQGIIEKFKRRYRVDLMEKILLEKENNARNNDFINTFDILDACNLCALAWYEVTSNDIRNCWRNLIPLPGDDGTETVPVTLPNNEAFYALMERMKKFRISTPTEVDNWLQVDYDDNGWQPLSDNDILADRCVAVYKEEKQLDDAISHNDQHCSRDDSILDDNYPTLIETLNESYTFLHWYKLNGENAEVLKALERAHEELVRRMNYE